MTGLHRHRYTCTQVHVQPPCLRINKGLLTILYWLVFHCPLYTTHVYMHIIHVYMYMHYVYIYIRWDYVLQNIPSPQSSCGSGYTPVVHTPAHAVMCCSPHCCEPVETCCYAVYRAGGSNFVMIWRKWKKSHAKCAKNGVSILIHRHAHFGTVVCVK